VRFAENVWGVQVEGKSKEQIAKEGLASMESWMREIGLVMNLRELGVTEEMIEGIAEGTFVMDGGYKILSHEEIVDILRKSME
jgi:alcohol dehydrogenase YqhD (iron-dependent ADH family)